MATEVIMPRQGQSVESCLLIGWKKKVGEAVKKGEALCEVETDKATFEIESPADGLLLAQLCTAGDFVPVLAPIAWIGAAGETVPRAASAPVGSPGAEIAGAPAAGARVFASPRARHVARERGIDLSTLRGSGPGGRIMERDLPAETQAAASLVAEAGRAAAGKPAAATPTTAGEEAIPLSGVRKLIGERMRRSLAEHAQLTLSSSADARALLAFRKRCKEAPPELGWRGVTVNDMVIYAAARVLGGFPDLNAHLSGGAIRRFRDVHAGFAVDTPRGLLVPVIREAHRRSLKDISAETDRLTQACLQGRVGVEEMNGGTFTITNLGALGIESFTPVLNSPQVAILGVCSIRPQPVETADGVSFVQSMGLSLTIDHQAVDGAPAARFLQALAQALANFDLLAAE